MFRCFDGVQLLLSYEYGGQVAQQLWRATMRLQSRSKTSAGGLVTGCADDGWCQYL
jgi:hypothetical protein